MISGCLAITSCCSLLFGFTPDLKNYFGFSDDIEILFFVIFFFLNGCFGGFIETGTTITLTHEFKHRIAVVTAGIGTFCGIGCMIGPPLGGVLYDAGGGDNSNSGFRLPFIVLAGFEMVLALVVAVFFKELKQEDEEDTTTGTAVHTGSQIQAVEEEKSVYTTSRMLTLGAIALNGTIVATLDPTLTYRLQEKPFHYSSYMIGIVFMASSISYTLVSIPVGWLIDLLPMDNVIYSSRSCKYVQGAGFFSLTVCFMMLDLLHGQLR
eukprot:UN23496